MIVSWPARAPKGVTSDHIGYFGDFMATAAALAGVEPPANLDSISFLPAILGQEDEQKVHDYLYWEFYERGSAQAVRAGPWKGIRKPMLEGEMEIYDVTADPGETRNVASEHLEIVEKIRRYLEEAHTPSDLWKVPDR